MSLLLLFLFIPLCVFSVLSESDEEKKKFLSTKGLNESEIDAAFQATSQQSREDLSLYIHDQERSLLALLAETILLPVTAALGVAGTVNYLWVSDCVGLPVYVKK